MPFLRRAWMPLVAGLLVITAGTYVSGALGLYVSYPGVDKFFHLLGGVVIAWFFFAVTRDNRWSTLLLATLVVGLVWELVEFYRLFGLTTGGPIDTVIDVIVDLLGAAIFTTLVRVRALPRYRDLA